MRSQDNFLKLSNHYDYYHIYKSTVSGEAFLVQWLKLLFDRSVHTDVYFFVVIIVWLCGTTFILSNRALSSSDDKVNMCGQFYIENWLSSPGNYALKSIITISKSADLSNYLKLNTTIKKVFGFGFLSCNKVFPFYCCAWAEYLPSISYQNLTIHPCLVESCWEPEKCPGLTWKAVIEIVQHQVTSIRLILSSSPLLLITLMLTLIPNERMLAVSCPAEAQSQLVGVCPISRSEQQEQDSSTPVHGSG